MVKVAMIGHKDFPSRSGGVEVMVGGLARSLVERGYDVTVYNRGLEKHHNVYDVDGVHARRVFTLQKPSLNATIYSFLATFDALFRGFDVIHYHAIGPSVPLLIAKLFGKHTVCTVHGLNWKVDKWRGFASRYMKLGEKIAAKYADDLVVLSETEWNYFLQKYDRASILILSRYAHAEGTVDKGFHFDAGFTDRGNFFAGELAGNHDSGNAVLLCPEGTLRRVNGHLRGSVNGYVRRDLPDQFQDRKSVV